MNSHSSHSGHALHQILDPFLFLFIGYKMRFLSFLCRKLLIRSQAAQCSQCSDAFCHQATLAFIGLMMTTCGVICQFAVFARRMSRQVLFRNIDHCIMCWPCCWAWCCMFQHKDHMEERWVFYVKVRTFDQLEHSKIWVLTVISVGIETLFVRYDMILSVWFM